MRLSENQGSKIYISFLLLLSFAFVFCQVGQAQAGEFVDKSLKGKYSFSGKGVGGDFPEVLAGIIKFDGKGNATGFGVWNRPDFTGNPASDRTTLKVDIDGTYQVDEDGSGTFSAVTSIGGVDIGAFDFTFVITQRNKQTTTDKAVNVILISDTLDQETGNLTVLNAEKLQGGFNFNFSSDFPF